MSTFEVTAQRLKVESHPNADSLELAQVGDFRAVVRKDQFRDGELGIYIPEDAVVPKWLLQQMGLWDETKGKGMLSGSKGTRVKAVKLRGELSQGLVMKLDRCSTNKGLEYFASIPTRPEEDDPIGHMLPVEEGQDVAKELGIQKYEIPLESLPAQLRGSIAKGNFYGILPDYDFDNIKKNPAMFGTEDEVVITEKIHGTFVAFGEVSSEIQEENKMTTPYVVSSKGLSKRGFALSLDGVGNVYVGSFYRYGMSEKIRIVSDFLDPNRMGCTYILGELFGPVQKGFDYGERDGGIGLRVFDVVHRAPDGCWVYVDSNTLDYLCQITDLQRVPVLYRGVFSKEKMLELTDGKTKLNGGPHIREGVVVRALWEQPYYKQKRRVAKSISEAYLLRKGGTEFN